MLHPCTPLQLATICIERRKGHSNALSESVSFFRSGESDLAYILLPPSGGSCASVTDLISNLSQDASILVLEHPNYVRPGGTSYSIEQLAAQFVAAIDSQSLNSKRYVLIGASFGGVVAFQMIRTLLSSRSKSPADVQLVLLDSPAAAQVVIDGPAKVLQEEEDSDITNKEPSPPVADPAVSDVQAENATALAGYEAAAIGIGIGTQDIDALYIAACSTAAAKTDNLQGRGETYWSGVLSKMSVERISGDHMDIWRGPNAASTVRFIENWYAGLRVD